jgi:cell fate regulator YaaT (PSP1 superfamily)
MNDKYIPQPKAIEAPPKLNGVPQAIPLNMRSTTDRIAPPETARSFNKTSLEQLPEIAPTAFQPNIAIFEVKPKKNIIPEPGKYFEVVFKSKRRRTFENPNELHLKAGDAVVVEVENGTDYGTIGAMCHCDKARMRNNSKSGEIFPILRIASADDEERFAKNRDEEQSVMEKTRDMVRRIGLEMKVIEAEWQFDRQRLTICFTAPNRIDFRELVKELARVFRTRIELRQISTREEAKQIGGLGSCGRSICCASFSGDFNHVTLDHARLQQLSNNVAKLSGYCGRLKCCLLYEYDNYLEAFKKYPPLHSIIELPEGRARMIKVDIFKDVVTVVTLQGNNFKSLPLAELNVLVAAGKVTAPPRDDNDLRRSIDTLCDGIDPNMLCEEHF